MKNFKSNKFLILVMLLNLFSCSGGDPKVKDSKGGGSQCSDATEEDLNSLIDSDILNLGLTTGGLGLAENTDDFFTNIKKINVTPLPLVEGSVDYFANEIDIEYKNPDLFSLRGDYFLFTLCNSTSCLYQENPGEPFSIKKFSSVAEKEKSLKEDSNVWIHSSKKKISLSHRVWDHKTKKESCLRSGSFRAYARVCASDHRLNIPDNAFLIGRYKQIKDASSEQDKWKKRLELSCTNYTTNSADLYSQCGEPSSPTPSKFIDFNQSVLYNLYCEQLMKNIEQRNIDYCYQMSDKNIGEKLDKAQKTRRSATCTSITVPGRITFQFCNQFLQSIKNLKSSEKSLSLAQEGCGDGEKSASPSSTQTPSPQGNSLPTPKPTPAKGTTVASPSTVVSTKNIGELIQDTKNLTSKFYFLEIKDSTKEKKCHKDKKIITKSNFDGSNYLEFSFLSEEDKDCEISNAKMLDRSPDNLHKPTLSLYWENKDPESEPYIYGLFKKEAGKTEYKKLEDNDLYFSSNVTVETESAFSKIVLELKQSSAGAIDEHGYLDNNAVSFPTYEFVVWKKEGNTQTSLTATMLNEASDLALFKPFVIELEAKPTARDCYKKSKATEAYDPKAPCANQSFLKTYYNANQSNSSCKLLKASCEAKSLLATLKLTTIKEAYWRGSSLKQKMETLKSKMTGVTILETDEAYSKLEVYSNIQRICSDLKFISSESLTGSYPLKTPSWIQTISTNYSGAFEDKDCSTCEKTYKKLSGSINSYFEASTSTTEVTTKQKVIGKREYAWILNENHCQKLCLDQDGCVGMLWDKNKTCYYWNADDYTDMKGSYKVSVNSDITTHRSSLKKARDSALKKIQEAIGDDINMLRLKSNPNEALTDFHIKEHYGLKNVCQAVLGNSWDVSLTSQAEAQTFGDSGSATGSSGSDLQASIAANSVLVFGMSAMMLIFGKGGETDQAKQKRVADEKTALDNKISNAELEAEAKAKKAGKTPREIAKARAKAKKKIEGGFFKKAGRALKSIPKAAYRRSKKGLIGALLGAAGMAAASAMGLAEDNPVFSNKFHELEKQKIEELKNHQPCALLSLANEYCYTKRLYSKTKVGSQENCVKDHLKYMSMEFTKILTGSTKNAVISTPADCKNTEMSEKFKKIQ